MRKLAIISTHPIQYNAPFFKLLAASSVLEIKVFYTWSQSRNTVADKDFGKSIQWDIPLLDNYSHAFIENKSSNPGVHTFKGLKNPSLISSIEKWGANALLVYGWNFRSHLKAMRYFKGKIPVFFRGDSTLLDEQAGLKTMLRRFVLKRVYKNIDYAFYVGTNNKAYFQKHGIKEKNLFFAPHAIDNERFFDSDGSYAQKAKELRIKNGINPESILFTFVGKFIPKKDPVFFLNEAKKISSDKASFVFIGNGEMEDELKSLSENHTNIHFMPFQNQSEMPLIYYMSDVLCLPSKGKGETWGLVINEAMSCERAILASDKAGCAIDLVENAKNGYMFSSGNKKALLEALKNLSSSKDDLKKMGQYSREKIQKWSYEEAVKGIETGLLKVFSE